MPTLTTISIISIVAPMLFVAINSMLGIPLTLLNPVWFYRSGFTSASVSVEIDNDHYEMKDEAQAAAEKIKDTGGIPEKYIFKRDDGEDVIILRQVMTSELIGATYFEDRGNTILATFIVRRTIFNIVYPWMMMSIFMFMVCSIIRYGLSPEISAVVILIFLLLLIGSVFFILRLKKADRKTCLELRDNYMSRVLNNKEPGNQQT